MAITIQVENEEFSTSSKVCTKLGYLEIAKPPKKDAKSLEELDSKLKDI